MIQIETLAVGPFLSNCYIVSCGETRDAVIIDAGDEAERILAAVERLGVTVKSVINTHGHLDHVAGLAEVVDALSVPVLMHRNDLKIYEMVPDQAVMFGLEAPRRVAIDRFVEDGEALEVGKLRLDVTLTPGHSPGAISLGTRDENPPRLFVGDVLFRGSIGRTDLPGGSYEVMVSTLRERIITFPDDTVVYPGHGPETTIGEEKRTNPFVAPLAYG